MAKLVKANETFSAGQFLSGSLSHFTLTHTGLAATDMKHIVETIGARATVVILGAIDTNDIRVAVENNGAWNSAAVADDPASLSLTLGAGWAVADFAY